jgi:hypothetical protein
VQLVVSAQRWETVARELLTELATDYPFATLTASVRNTYTSLLRGTDTASGEASESVGSGGDGVSARSLSSLSSRLGSIGSFHSLPSSTPGSAPGSALNTPLAGMRALPLPKVKVPLV